MATHLSLPDPVESANPIALAQALDRLARPLADVDIEFLEHILRQVQTGTALNPRQEASIRQMYRKYHRPRSRR